MPNTKKQLGDITVSLYVRAGNVTVTIEMNTILRGCVFQGQEWEVSRALSQRLEIDLYTTANLMSVPDLYGGKICAALDRQHPRDLFDVKILFENEGITNDIRKAFIVYLVGHDRPMAELLVPQRLDIRKVFENEFQGMTDVPITLEELVSVREKLISTIENELTDDERRFLVSMKYGDPQWELLDIEGIEQLPALQWKLTNIRKMPKPKHLSAVKKLREVVGL